VSLAGILAFVGLTLAPSSDEGGALAAAADASDRPRVCRASALASRPTVWAVAREPNRARYCALVAAAARALRGDPERAATIAGEAAALWPGEPGAAIVLARARLAADRPSDALATLDTIEAKHAREFGAPRTLRTRARALARVGRLDDARRAYRALAPRLALLPPREATTYRVEDALTSTARARAASDPDRTPLLEDALATARAAAGETTDTDALPWLVVALVAERLGRLDDASAALEQAAERAPPSTAAIAAAVVDPIDAPAIEALAARAAAQATSARGPDRPPQERPR
jgi:tetratricopeptide (TPR) repeat protein